MYYYLMALCHSTVWNLLFSIGSSTNHVTVRELAMLPVPDCTDSSRRQLADLVRSLCSAGERLRPAMNRLINSYIYRLFSFNQAEVELIEKYSQNCMKGLP
jgi:hypothetical protein